MPDSGSSLLRFVLALTCAFALSAQAPTGKPVAQPPQDPDTAVAALEARLAQARDDATLPEQQKTTLVELLSRALEHAKAREQRRESQRQFAAQQQTAADRLAERKAELSALEDKKPGPPRPNMSLEELEQGLAAAEQGQRDAQQRVAAANAERGRRAQRRSEIPTELSDRQQRLAALPDKPSEDPAADVRIAAARRLALTVERQRLQAAIDALQAELADYDAEAELLRTEGDVAARLVTTTQADVDAWRSAVQPMRERAAAEAAAQAREEAARASPQLAPIAQQNQTLADVLAELARQRAASERESAEREQLKQALQQQFTELRSRVELVGADERIGELLRRRRSQLVQTWRRHQRSVRDRRNRLIDAQLDQIEYQDRRRRLIEDPDGWLGEQLGEGTSVADLTPDQVRVAEKLRDTRRDLLQKLADGYGALVVTEDKVQATEKDLTELIRGYSEYVTERVLGIRSAQPLWLLDLDELGEALAWFGSAQHWRELPALSMDALADRPLLGLVPLCVLALLLLRRRLRRALREYGQQAKRGTNVDFAPTALAALYTLLVIAPLPALAIAWGFALDHVAAAGSFAKAVAGGLVALGVGVAAVSALSAASRRDGLGEAHFRWQATTATHVRRALPFLWIAAAPLSFALIALHAHGDDAWLGSLGSLLLTGQLLLFTIVGWRLLHPSKGIVGGSLKPTPGALHRFRTVWFVLGVGVLIALTVMTALGYEYTAQQVKARAFLSLLGLGAIALVHQLILRVLLLQRRRLQIQRARQRLQAARTGEAAEAEEQHELDPQALAEQTQALLRSAVVVAVAVLLYQIWVDVLPALGILRQFRVWNIGDAELEQWITLADVLLGAFVLLASFVAARNLPALLELFVLRRMSMQAGERNAITTLTRYLIVIIGVVWAFSSVGIGWSKVQWLVAAVSLGLGFGLQEIFANFVSGLILLIERPMRPGDLVTVGDTVGRVQRIQMRATTIRDLTRKELVVPNREFVTSRFVNWTLGDPTVRYSVPVGVAYGSDTELAIRLLLQAARECKRILDDPPPEAYFVGFGDSTLNLELRLFVDINTVEWTWMTDVHQAIDALFKQHDIVIAFPQRDVNLKLPDDLAARLSAPDARTAP